MTFKPLVAPRAGAPVHLWRDTDDGGEVASVQDLGPMIEANKRAYDHNDGYTPDRTMRRVGFIPDIIRQKWLNEEGWDAYDPDCSAKLMQKLNDPDWRYLRTAPGTLGKIDGGFR